jgi:hypothetical protein
VLFNPPDPGSGMEQWSDPDPGSEINNPGSATLQQKQMAKTAEES